MGKNSASQAAETMPQHHCCQSLQKEGKLRLEELIKNMQTRLYDRVKSETKASLILCFTGNVHLPWKEHCLLQLRTARSAKARGNVIGQWLSGKQYNPISTSASQLDLVCPMTRGKGELF